MLSVLLPPEGAGRIACRVTHSVLAFHHRAAVQGFPCRWQAFGPVCSPVAGRGNAVCCLLRWLLKSGGRHVLAQKHKSACIYKSMLAN